MHLFNPLNNAVRIKLPGCPNHSLPGCPNHCPRRFPQLHLLAIFEEEYR